MKPIVFLLIISVSITIYGCSKNEDTSQPQTGVDGKLKEKEMYLPAGEEYKSYLQQYSYDAAGKIIKISNFLKKGDGSAMLATYDSMVYVNGRLDRHYGFQYDMPEKQFILENRMQYFYQNNLLEHTELYLDGMGPDVLVSKTFHTYENGKEVMQKVYDAGGNLLNGFTTVYQGDHVAELRHFNSEDKPTYKFIHHYTNSILTSTNEYDVEGSTSEDKSLTQYEYQNGRLRKEIYTTMPFYYHFADSAVYRY